MRSYAFAIAVGALFAFPISAFSQGVEVGPRGVEVQGPKLRADLSGEVVRKCGKLV